MRSPTIRRSVQLLTVSFLIGTQLIACSTPTNHVNSSVSEDAADITSPTENPIATEQTTPLNMNQQTSSPTSETIADETAAPSMKYRMNAVYRFIPIDKTTTDKAVLLTFDDGPKDETVLKSILDTLDKHEAKAIFFVNGYRVKQNPELLKLIFDRGQTIGNHSWDHNDLKKETEEVIEQQIGDLQTQIESLVDIKPKFFRPPYGSAGDLVKKIAKNHGMLFMTWSNGSLDWDKSAKNKPDEVIRNVMEQLHPGANILMHELQWTADALDELLNKLEKEGYSFIDPSTIDVTD